MISLELIGFEKCFGDSVKLRLLDISDSIKFITGQYITIILNRDMNLFKSFSIASSPKELPELEVVFRITDDEFSNFVKDRLTIGDILFSLPPEGEFTLESAAVENKNIVLFAIGSGIAPIYSILKTELGNSINRNFILFWGNKNIEKAYYWNEITDLAKRFQSQFRLINYFTDEQFHSGYKCRMSSWTIINELAIQEIDIKNSEYFICGNSQFVKDISKILFTQQVKKEKIHIEKYDYAFIKSKIVKEISALKK